MRQQYRPNLNQKDDGRWIASEDVGEEGDADWRLLQQMRKSLPGSGNSLVLSYHLLPTQPIAPKDRFTRYLVNEVLTSHNSWYSIIIDLATFDRLVSGTGKQSAKDLFERFEAPLPKGIELDRLDVSWANPAGKK